MRWMLLLLSIVSCKPRAPLSQQSSLPTEGAWRAMNEDIIAGTLTSRSDRSPGVFYTRLVGTDLLVDWLTASGEELQFPSPDPEDPLPPFRLSLVPLFQAYPGLDPLRFAGNVRGILASSSPKRTMILYGAEGALILTRKGTRLVVSQFLPVPIQEIVETPGSSQILWVGGRHQTAIHLGDWESFENLADKTLLTQDFLFSVCSKYGYAPNCQWTTVDGSDFGGIQLWNEDGRTRLFTSGADGLAYFYNSYQTVERHQGISSFGTHRFYNLATLSASTDAEPQYQKQQLPHPGIIKAAIRSHSGDLWFLGLQGNLPKFYFLPWNLRFISMDLPRDDGYVLEFMPKEPPSFCQVLDIKPLYFKQRDLFYVTALYNEASPEAGVSQVCNESSLTALFVYELSVKKMKHNPLNMLRWIWDSIPVSGSLELVESIPMDRLGAGERVFPVHAGKKGEALLWFRHGERPSYTFSRELTYE